MAAAARITANSIQIFGKQYNIDSQTNLTPKIASYIGRNIYQKKNNPLYLLSEKIRAIFIDGRAKQSSESRPKFQEHEYRSPVVTIEDNFDSLLIPANHVSRAKADTYYVNSEHLLRSHTSAHQLHCLKKGSKAFISIADCYRRDEIDSRHFPVFHQCEIFELYNQKQIFGNNNLSSIYDSNNVGDDTKQAKYSAEANKIVVEKMKATIEETTRQMLDLPTLETRWVDAYFPFTHPSFELEILFNGRWVEVLGCGIVREEILNNGEVPSGHIGFAAGFGLERFAMLNYQIPDIRLFWSNDSGFTHQFENKSPFDKVVFKPFSSCPQCINDLSFWLPTNEDEQDEYNPNDFYDLVRSIGDELIEQVQLIDEYVNSKTKKKSHCYKIVYRANDRVLTKSEVNALHSKIAAESVRQLKVTLR